MGEPPLGVRILIKAEKKVTPAVGDLLEGDATCRGVCELTHDLDPMRLADAPSVIGHRRITCKIQQLGRSELLLLILLVRSGKRDAKEVRSKAGFDLPATLRIPVDLSRVLRSETYQLEAVEATIAFFGGDALPDRVRPSMEHPLSGGHAAEGPWQT
jgi:hypothetical protein